MYEQIKQEALKQNISLKRLAEMIGIKPWNMYRQVNDQSMKIKTLIKISVALKVPIGVFFIHEDIFECYLDEDKKRYKEEIIELKRDIADLQIMLNR